MSDWIAVRDPTSGKTYYTNMKTRETSWDIPPGYQGQQPPQVQYNPQSQLNMNQQQQQQQQTGSLYCQQNQSMAQQQHRSFYSGQQHQHQQPRQQCSFNGLQNEFAAQQKAVIGFDVNYIDFCNRIL